MNLRPAPFSLTPATVASLVGDRPAARGVVAVPVEPVLLTDGQRRETNKTNAGVSDAS